MKILLISDVHANVDALYAVERAEKSWDAVWFLGDMLEFGFHPHETVQWMREHNAVAVTGNHDRGILAAINEGRSFPPADQSTSFLDYTCALLTEDDIAWLRTIPEDHAMTADGFSYYLTHYYNGDDKDRAIKEHVEFQCYNVFDQVWRSKVGEPKLGEQRRILFGHSHQCIAFQVRSDMMFLNPGSLSYRIGADSESCKGGDYMIIEDGEFRMKHVSYNTSHLLKMAENSSLTGFSKDVAKVFFAPQE